MNETATLRILVESTGSKQAKQELDALTGSASRAEKSTSGLMGVFARLAAPILSTAGALALFNKTLNTTVAFETFNARLKTATGSAENAKVAFDALIDFANETPYGLEQATNAFIQLTNRGLTPSERALRSYGNAAFALGYSLEDLAYAVSATVAGEFEPLRKLGIQARKEADGLAITFQGATTRIKNDIRSVEEYFIALGENQFAGAMAEGMDTLRGKISQLGDSWDQLFATIGEHGFGQMVKDSIDIAQGAINDLRYSIDSGEFGAVVDALANRFSVFGEDAARALDMLSGQFEIDAERWGNSVSFVADAFMQWPENVSAAAKLVAIGAGALFLHLESIANTTIQRINGVTVDATLKVLAVFREMQSHLPGQKDFDFSKAWDSIKTAGVSAASRVEEEWKNSQREIADTVKLEAGKVLDARNQVLDTYQKEIDAAKRLRAEYEMNLKIEKELRAFFGEYDRLEQFGRNKGKPLPMQTESQRNQFQALKDSLLGEEEAVAESYNRRRDLIINNTGDNIALQEQLLEEMRVREVYDTIEAGEQKAARLESQFQLEQLLLQNSLDSKQISEAEFQRQSRENWRKYQEDVSKIAVTGATTVKTKNLETQAMVLSMAADLSGQLSALAKKDSDSAKALFIVSKAVAIAQAIVNTELAATAALTAGPYLGIPMATLVRGTGYASVGIMAATAVAQYEDGGIVPGTSFTGDRVPARVNSGEMILNDAQQQNLWRMANGQASGTSGSKVTVNVINQAGAEVETQERDTPDGKVIDVLVKRMASEMANSIRSGQGPVPAALQQTFNLRRGAA